MKKFWKKYLLFGTAGVILNAYLLYVASREMAGSKPDVEGMP